MKKILTIMLACTSAFSLAQKPKLPPVPVEPEVYASIHISPEIARTGDSHGRTFQGLDSAGYRKHVKYNRQTGELFLQYHFKKNNEEFVYEKTLNAAEKSDTERQRIIERFENEIELPGKGMEM